MKIAVLYGGISPERNVSIVGGQAVMAALKSKGYEVIGIDPALGEDKERKAEKLVSNIESFTSLEELENYDPRNIINCVNSNLFDDVDCAFLVLHGKYGEDGSIQTLLELREIPYTGSGPRASAIAMDKLTSKSLFMANGILTPPWEIIHPADADDHKFLADLRKALGKNIVIKPADLGSTIGLTILKDATVEEVSEAIREASKFSTNLLAERYIEGREITVAVVDGEALPVIEIKPKEDFYDYKHKYSKGATEYVCPAEIPEDVADFVQNLAISAYNSLGCKCFARIDFILDADNQPYCLELNTIPGFSSTSLVPMAAKQIGIEFPDLCELLINKSLEL